MFSNANIAQMANHPHRAGRPSPSPEEVRAARGSVGHTQTQAANTVFITLNAWQRYEQGDRRMPPGLRELYSLKTGAPVYAVYDTDAIYGVGESVGAALLDADMAGQLVPQSHDDRYPDGVVVDLTAAHRLSPDSEVAFGQAKMRRCTVRLYQRVLASGGGVAAFTITPAGMLDIDEDD
ncbi:hypothetical protein V8Z80_08635 [Orrella sp. JC864]|uniref:hypothetical protein n=1 Tax=Orrella sp. JC864 TaxID=3120298 RepID=UPI0030087A7E